MEWPSIRDFLDVPSHLTGENIAIAVVPIIPYHGCPGITFEGKRIPEILAPAENVVLPLPFQSTDKYENHYTAPFDKLPYGYARTEGISYAAPIVG